MIDELIRQRAYEISQSNDAGSADENWQRAAREIEAELQAESEDRPQPRTNDKPTGLGQRPGSEA